MLIFLGCIFTTTYNDHSDLVTRNHGLRLEIGGYKDHEEKSVQKVKEDLGGKLSDLRENCAKTEGANGILTKQAADQQNTINNCQTQALKLLTPEAQKTTPLVLEDTVVDGVEHKAKFLILTNKTVTPVRMIVNCNRAVRDGFASILGSGVMTGGTTNQTPTALNVGIDSPAWTPISPMIVAFSYTSSSLIQCGFLVR